MFQLNTLTFGVSSSPFLAIRTLQQLADDESLVHPRASKIIKSHLYVDDLLTGAETFDQARVIRDEIIALLVRGGFILNSRPITAISSDPNDLLVLSPAHCLIGKSLTSLPEENLLSVPDNRLSTWHHIQKVRQDFWSRWSLEYLNELQTRAKWDKDKPNLTVGDVVLIKDRTLPCTQWALGRITSLHPDDDGVIRVATMKTATGELKRSVKTLCPLPVES
ncbi:hypothetical protein ALC57_15107 [Trachymyrmex cornetzi]|uniref:DUF5641 domain-containing protein n=1 Tax=Trachymyrmex cornetzi TaxID=471704 RepID=A0A151IXJ7_9HYME|nr:hypothetical protein ALC57_15107 [Trachymyrmex cornetzi]